MAQFNLADYETVEERLRRFWSNPNYLDARIVTANRSTDSDRAKGIWVVETRIYLSGDDQANDLPKATGWAFEIDGTAGANKTSALENAETSAIGRALANMNLSGNKRASREEMQKVAADVTPARNWVNEASNLHFSRDKEALKALYLEAQAAKVSADVLTKITEYGQKL